MYIALHRAIPSAALRHALIARKALRAVTATRLSLVH